MRNVVQFVACVLLLMPLTQELSAQEKIWQSDPDYFESFPSEQLDEWTDLLWSLKSAKLLWPENIMALKALPWVDFSWIESSLLNQDKAKIPTLLLSAYADEATRATIEWVYGYNAKRSKSSVVKAIRKYDRPNIQFISSARSELNDQADAQAINPDYLQRLSISTPNTEIHVIATQASFHEYHRWSNPKLWGGYLKTKRGYKGYDIDFIAGRIRAKFGTGLIGQSVPFLMLASTGTFLKPSSTFSGSLNRSPQQSILGAGFSISSDKIQFTVLSGFQNMSTSSNNSEEGSVNSEPIYATIRRSNEWTNRELTPTTEIATHLFHAKYRPSNWATISIQSQYSQFKRLQFNGEKLKPRIDTEMGIRLLPKRGMEISSHLAHYAGKTQALFSSVGENEIIRLTYLFGFWQQSPTDPFRRTPLLIGTTGNQRLMLIKGQLFRNKRNSLSFLLAFIDKDSPFEVAKSTKRWQAEIRLPWRTSKNIKQLLTTRFYRQLDLAFDNNRTYKDRIQLNWMVEAKMNGSIYFQLRTGLNTSTENSALFKPSLFISNHIKWQGERLILGFRMNEMMISEQNAMQRLDAWSMGNQFRDVIVRNHNSTAYQLYSSFDLYKRFRLIINYTRQINHSTKTVQSLSNQDVFVMAKEWLNLELRINL